MRLYAKLLAMIAAFALLAAPAATRRAAADLAFDARVAYVSAFGDAAAFEGLVEDTRRRTLAEHGWIDWRPIIERYTELLAADPAAAAEYMEVVLGRHHPPAVAAAGQTCESWEWDSDEQLTPS